MRTATITRKTGETQITLTLNLDGSGKCDVKNPIGFFDHMLKSFCKHGLFDLSGELVGDLDVDQHHLIEDTGIVLGMCFAKALGDCAGIFRSGFFIYPMDETLVQAAVDFGCCFQSTSVDCACQGLCYHFCSAKCSVGDGNKKSRGFLPCPKLKSN